VARRASLRRGAVAPHPPAPPAARLAAVVAGPAPRAAARRAPRHRLARDLAACLSRLDAGAAARVAALLPGRAHHRPARRHALLADHLARRRAAAALVVAAGAFAAALLGQSEPVRDPALQLLDEHPRGWTFIAAIARA